MVENNNIREEDICFSLDALKKLKIDGNKKYAFVITLFGGHSYLPGLLCTAAMLKRELSENNIKNVDVVAQITEDSYKDVEKLVGYFVDVVKVVPYIIVKDVVLQTKLADRPGYEFVFTKLWALTYSEYEKVILVDADLLPIDNYRYLFGLDTPAGALALPYAFKKIHRDLEWHDIYCECCATNSPIPSMILPFLLFYRSRDVKAYKYGLRFGGMNASLFVLKPNQEEFDAIMSEVSNYGDKPKWSFPEQQYLTLRWSFGSDYSKTKSYDGKKGLAKEAVDALMKDSKNKVVYCDDMQLCRDDYYKLKKSMIFAFDYYDRHKIFSQKIGPWHGIHPIFYSSKYETYSNPYGLTVYDVKKPWEYNSSDDFKQTFVDVYGIREWYSYATKIFSDIYYQIEEMTDNKVVDQSLKLIVQNRDQLLKEDLIDDVKIDFHEFLSKECRVEKVSGFKEQSVFHKSKTRDLYRVGYETYLARYRELKRHFAAT